jgi:hypothetical protein
VSQKLKRLFIYFLILGMKFPELPFRKEKVLLLKERVDEAKKISRRVIIYF